MSPLREFLLAFADDEHLIGQQHTEWIGVAPFLEEDLAFSSIGQDELGHAAVLYELVLELDGIAVDDQAIDALAFGRDPSEYRSSALDEYTTTDWAEALVRHWIHDTAEQLRWANLTSSSLQSLADASARIMAEETIHVLHANALLDVLLGVDDARVRLNEALDRLLPLVPSVLASVEGESELVEAGLIARSTEESTGALADAISSRFERRVELEPAAPGRTTRSEHFAPLMARMREVIDLDPTAIW